VKAQPLASFKRHAFVRADGLFHAGLTHDVLPKDRVALPLFLHAES
jgi:hypothetical protein